MSESNFIAHHEFSMRPAIAIQKFSEKVVATMPLLHWSPPYSVNNPDLDAEHQALFIILNDFYSRIIAGDLTQSEGTSFLDKILNNTSEHCAHEEALLGLARYPELINHHNQHEDFLETLRGYLASSKSASADYVRIAEALLEWVLTHVFKEDQRFKNYLG